MFSIILYTVINSSHTNIRMLFIPILVMDITTIDINVRMLFLWILFIHIELVPSNTYMNLYIEIYTRKYSLK